MPFHFKGLSAQIFAPLFDLNEDELAERNMIPMIADEKPGFPCRVSLEDAEPGERVLLLPYEHHSAHSPYRASGPIFVREAAHETFDRAEIPSVLRDRMLSVRAYDRNGVMIDAGVVEGRALEPELERLFGRRETDYAHIHYAKRGCYACRVERD
jgi:hypothetical protein